MTKCRSCGADIIWIITKTGRKMPCNAEPIFFDLADMKGEGVKTFVKDDGTIAIGIENPEGQEVGYISHFATCPEADKWRTKKI